MSIGVFSEFRPTGVPALQTKSFNRVEEKINPQKEKGNGNFFEKTKTIAPVVVPLLAIPATAAVTYKMFSKNTNLLKEQIKSLTKQVSVLEAASNEGSKTLNTIQNTLKTGKKDNAKIWSILLGIGGLTGIYHTSSKMTQEQKNEAGERIINNINGIQNTANEAASIARQTNALSSNNLAKKYVKDFYGIQLLTNSDSLNKNAQKYMQAITQIQTAAPKRLYEKPKVEPIQYINPHDEDYFNKALKTNYVKPALWSVTSEFAPIKEGGLGSVPVELQKNISKLGINIPTFIPMYQQEGIASFKTVENGYIYQYKKQPYVLQKAASFKVNTYQAGRPKTEEVEIFVAEGASNGNPLIFVKNDNYFNGTIYQTSEKTEEPEKFAFFSKVIYELAKAKNDINSVKDLNIHNYKVFESIPKPDALILNDWQASPIAALARYKAPMENAYGRLSDEAAKKLSDMTIITIGHNAMYQGSTRINNNDEQRREATSNILNTLFDNFAYDIVTNAKTDASSKNPADAGLKNLDNVLISDAQNYSANHTNLLNMGICLSDYFHPVSQNYAKELISDEHPELSGELRWVLTQKDKAGSLVGIINGNDFNNLSIGARAKKSIEGTGVKPEIYDKTSSLEEVLNAREKNKVNFYNNFMMPFTKKNDKSNTSKAVEDVRQVSAALEFVDATGRTKLPELSEEEIKATPILTSVGRFVSQKGINIMAESINMLFENWEKDFPNKPKPIFYIAGQDGEGGVQRKYIEDLKDKKLSQEDTNRVIFAHGFAPMTAITSASDFFLMPSIFEPCGLTQGEAFAVGTPVIGSAVGGIVDTVNRNGKTNGVLTDKSKPLTAQSFYEAMKQALNIYFNDKPKYQNMVKDALAEDFSWIQKGKQGPVFEYLDKIGFDISKLPDVA